MQATNLMTNKLPDNFADLAVELWAAAQVPASAQLGGALRKLLNWRLEDTQEILITELRQTKRRLSRVGEVDEAAAMVVRFIRAAREGTGRVNLRIMAQVIRGLSNRPRLRASDFLRFADAVANLTLEEITALATLHEKTLELEAVGVARDRDNEAWAQTVDELVPSEFADEQRLAAVMLAASRSGLITKTAPFKLGPFACTDLLYELAELASLSKAVAEEGHEI
jgi:hypothetical protein